MHECTITDGGKDAIHRILNREDKAGRKLTQVSSGIHETGGVWQKIQAIDHVKKIILKLLMVFSIFINIRHCVCYTTSQSFPSLNSVSF